MSVELKDKTTIINTLFDGQPYTCCYSPLITQASVVEKATIFVLGSAPSSPGFRALQKLAVCQSLISDREVKPPFTPRRYLDEEMMARKNHWLSTVGSELEVPHQAELDSKDLSHYSVLDYLKIGHGMETCRWEHILPYSYSWKTQAALLHQLLDLRFIPFRQANWQPGPRGRFIAEADYFSLHYNIGIPEDTEYHPGLSPVNSFKEDACYLAIACGLAFSSPGRLLNRKTSEAVTIEKECDRSDKTLERKSFGRVEIRTLGFGNSRSYEQLMLIQEIASVFLAFYRKSPKFDTQLSNQHLLLYSLWGEVRADLREFLDCDYKVTNIFNDRNEDSRKGLKKILETTDIQTKMRGYLHLVAAEGRKLIWRHE